MHNFLKQVVTNLRTQAAFVASLMAAQKEDKTWKMEAEASIHRVETAGNQLEERVGQMGEEAFHVRMEQTEKFKAIDKTHQELDKEVI